MLFASQEVLGTAAGTAPGLAAELLGPAWLGLAALNWFSRGSRVGGIYGRPLLLANLLLFVPSAVSLARMAAASGQAVPQTPIPSPAAEPAIFWVLALCFGVFAVLFLRRLLKRPEADLDG